MKQNKEIYDFLEKYLGIDIQVVSEKYLDIIISRWMDKMSISLSLEFLDYIKSNQDVMNEFIDDVIVKETWFFRDSFPFLYLINNAKKIINSFGIPKINILSLPCSSGEEPFSICIALLEAQLKLCNFDLFAFDISKQALKKANAGIFRKISFREESFMYLQNKYWKKTDNIYNIDNTILNKVNFISGNVFKDDSEFFNMKFHIVFCRNFIIYLNDNAKTKLVKLLKKILFQNALLFVGNTEMNFFKQHNFTPLNEKMIFCLVNSKNNNNSKTDLLKLNNNTNYPNTKLFSKNTTTNNSFNDYDNYNNQKFNVHTDLKKSKKILKKNLMNKDIYNNTKLPYKSETKNGKQETKTNNHKTINSNQEILRVRQLADAGNLIEALTLCNNILLSNKTNFEIYFLLGSIYSALNDYEESEKNFLKCLYLNPNHYEAAEQLYFYYKCIGDDEKSVLYKRKLELVSN